MAIFSTDWKNYKWLELNLGRVRNSLATEYQPMYESLKSVRETDYTDNRLFNLSSVLSFMMGYSEMSFDTLNYQLQALEYNQPHQLAALCAHNDSVLACFLRGNDPQKIKEVLLYNHDVRVRAKTVFFQALSKLSAPMPSRLNDLERQVWGLFTNGVITAEVMKYRFELGISHQQMLQALKLAYVQSTHPDAFKASLASYHQWASQHNWLRLDKVIMAWVKWFLSIGQSYDSGFLREARIVEHELEIERLKAEVSDDVSAKFNKEIRNLYSNFDALEKLTQERLAQSLEAKPEAVEVEEATPQVAQQQVDQIARNLASLTERLDVLDAGIKGISTQHEQAAIEAQQRLAAASQQSAQEVQRLASQVEALGQGVQDITTQQLPKHASAEEMQRLAQRVDSLNRGIEDITSQQLPELARDSEQTFQQALQEALQAAATQVKAQQRALTKKVEACQEQLDSEVASSIYLGKASLKQLKEELTSLNTKLGLLSGALMKVPFYQALIKQHCARVSQLNRDPQAPGTPIKFATRGAQDHTLFSTPTKSPKASDTTLFDTPPPKETATDQTIFSTP